MTFQDYLKQCRDEVKTWPEWKQNILGGPMPTRRIDARIPRDLHDQIRDIAADLVGEDDPMSMAIEIVLRRGLKYTEIIAECSGCKHYGGLKVSCRIPSLTPCPCEEE